MNTSETPSFFYRKIAIAQIKATSLSRESINTFKRAVRDHNKRFLYGLSSSHFQFSVPVGLSLEVRMILGSDISESDSYSLFVCKSKHYEMSLLVKMDLPAEEEIIIFHPSLFDLYICLTVSHT